MNKYSNLSNQEISDIFTSKADIDTWRKRGDGTFKFADDCYDAFTEKHCFGLIESYALSVNCYPEMGLWNVISDGIAVHNKDLKRAILECVLMIEERRSE